MKIQFAAPCLFGLESFVADELRNMGAEAVAPKTDASFLKVTNTCLRAPIFVRDLRNGF